MKIEDVMKLNAEQLDTVLDELYNRGKDLVESKNELRETEVLHEEAEAILVSDMIANPKDYGLRKTTNVDLKYAVCRNASNITRRQDINILKHNIDMIELDYNIIKESIEILKKFI